VICRESLFSPDGKHIAFAAKRGDYWFAVVDGVEGRRYDAISEGLIQFSPDGQHFAYAGKQGTTYVTVKDNVEIEKCYEMVTGLTFSPDSKHLVYWGKRGEKYYLVLDGIESKESYTKVLLFPNPIFGISSRLVFDSNLSFNGVACRNSDVLLLKVHIGKAKREY
jgi:WD40 repeat protein